MWQPIDTKALKREHPVDEVIATYGIPLRPSGRTLVGRCPFHPDGGRPNLHVYPASSTWYCFRCGAGGDVISFVERIEGVAFRQATTLLAGVPRRSGISPPGRLRSFSWSPDRRAGGRHARGPDERACLSAAVELYHNRLLAEPSALGYVIERGIDRATIERCRIGYATGDDLSPYLRWRKLPPGAAVRVGLLGRGGREHLAGRIVVPEIRAGQPIWLVGRTVHSGGSVPRYLGLPGRKPLLGWENASGEASIYLVEGVFDWLTLRSWGLPALASLGTHLGSAALRALSRFARVYLVLDGDDAGRQATAELAGELGDRARAVRLPSVKDVAELAPLPRGRAVFTRAVQESEHGPVGRTPDHTTKEETMSQLSEADTGLPVVPDAPQVSREGALPRATVELLSQPLDARLIAQRQGVRGTMLRYIEGHQAINQANRIFGHGRWGAEVVAPVGYRELSRTDRKTGEIVVSSVYWATVRVRASGCEPRSDVGFAVAADDTPEAHDTAIKGAVTDAMKRALRHFGDQFGNSLYERPTPSREAAAPELTDLRAAVVTLGGHLGLDEAATREQAAKKIGRPFAEQTAAELARVIRAMAVGLRRRQRAA